MTGLFDDVLSGNYNGTSESAIQLSYEEESYIENEITADPVSLSNYCSEGYEAITAALGALAISEGLAATEILKGGDKRIAMESLASRAEDAYDTIKRWAKRIWKAIKKFVSKAWAHIKHIADKVKAFFTNYESVLRDTDGGFNVSWCHMDIEALAREVNQDYHLQEMHNMRTGSIASHDFTDSVRNIVVTRWRNALYGTSGGGNAAVSRARGNSSTINGGAPTYTPTPWTTVKPEVLRVTTMGYDKWSRDFLNWGEKDFREAISLDKDSVDDRTDTYDDIDEDKNITNKDQRRADYEIRRNDARMRIKLARTKLQLRQRGCQMLAAATTRHFNQCVAAAKVALKHKHGVHESTYIDSSSVGGIVTMLL